MKKTIEKILALMLALALMCVAFTACGSTAEDEDSVATEGGDTDSLVNSFLKESESSSNEESTTIEYDASATVVAGTYIYDDYKADMDFSIIWTFVLYEDGSYDLSEDNPFIGVAEYGGQTSETDGNRVNCGAMDADRSTTEGDWAYPTGFSILVDVDSMTFIPENISDEVFGREEMEEGEEGEGEAEDASEEASDSVAAEVTSGTFIYDDYKEMVDAHIIWTLIVNEDGSFYLSEDNPFSGLKEYAGAEATIEGDQIICGAMDPAPDAGDWAFPEGFTVQIAGDGTFEPITFESFGETAG
ncbi:MAG: hypothetical protein LUC38_05050 [Oscillospiraceae bacterium]|nr:hypothetical protein [Oscillospiraceae bacterium]